MADLCPAASWTAIPELNRETTPAILFAPGCLPGTADAQGACATRNLRYTIAIPWSTFLAQARKAPGGNLYWDGSVPADRRNPTAFWLMNQMAIRNLVTFQARGKRGTERVSDALAKGFLTKIGLVSVPIDPTANETTDAFVARGGQLFYPPGDYYAFGGGTPIYSLVPAQLVGNAGQATSGGAVVEGRRRTPTELLLYSAIPSWMQDVRAVEVYANYVVAANRIDYTIRVDWANAGAQVVDSVVRWLEQNVSKLCTKLNDPSVVTATTAASATPVTAPYAAGATTVRQLCNLPANYAAMTGCTPRAPGSPGSVEALLAAPVVLSGKYMRFASLSGGKAAMSAQSAGAASAFAINPAAPVAPTPPAPPPTTTTYPTGTIAWYDPKTGYSIAVPAPAGGVTHRVIAMGWATVPAGVRVVDLATWERATLPWMRRRAAKIGFMVGGIALAVVGTAALVRQ